jgi:outer membrane cobalamin receptor
MKNPFRKILTAITFFVFLPGFIFAQQGGKVKGTILDKSNNTPLSSATVQIFETSDSGKLITGGSSDDKGAFEISDIPFGTYTIKISYIGYGNATAKNVVLSSDSKVKDLGTVKLIPGSEVTDVIEVTTEAPMMTVEGEKKIFDVKKDLTSQSGSVIDVLKNIPSVTVDNDNNVSLRGNTNIKILIDGKPSAMLASGTAPLQNLPANIVDKIEIINNPSAKYEAEGASGIINIVLKKNDIGGFNGNVKSNAGTEDKYNVSATTNFKNESVGITTLYSFWNYAVPGDVILKRTNYLSDSARFMNENMNWKYRGRSHYASIGIDYDLDKTNSLSLVTTGILFNRLRNANQNYFFFKPDNSAYLNYLNYTDNENDGYTLDLSLTHTKKFAEKGNELTTIASFSKRNENSVQDNKSIFSSTNQIFDRQTIGFHFNFFNFQSDYSKTFGEDMNLESGVKYNFRKIDGYQDYYNYDYNSSVWLTNTLRNNNADALDYIAAAYSTFSYKIKNFTVKAGLRGEFTKIDYKFQNNTMFVDRNYFDLFPSLSLSQTIGDKNSISLSYNRRINRPQLQSLNPFKDYTDPNTVMSGNPELKPEYINSAELSYTRYVIFGSVTPTLFYRRTTDNINFSQTMDANGVSTVKPENMGNINSYGAELMIQGGLASWWTFTISGSYYRNDLNGSLGSLNVDRSDYSSSARLNTTIAIPDICDVQYSYMYFGKQATLQGTVDPFQAMSLSLSKSFFEKRLVVAFRVNDLFNQQRFILNYSGTGYSNVLNQKSHSRAAFLTLTFNFGNMESTSSGKKILRKKAELEGEIQQSN